MDGRCLLLRAIEDGTAPVLLCLRTEVASLETSAIP
jgi:hypothetical protein